MSKKYSPSGYQIIELIIDGDGKVIESEDSKLLLSKIKNTNEKEKPLLLTLNDESEGFHVSGFSTWSYSGGKSLFFDFSESHYTIRVSDDELVVELA